MVGDKANAKDKKNVEVASKSTRQAIHIHKAQHGKYQSQAVALPNQGSVRCQACRKVLVLWYMLHIWYQAWADLQIKGEPRRLGTGAITISPRINVSGAHLHDPTV